MIRREFISTQFLRFLVSGVIAAAVNFSARLLYEYGIGLSYSLAIVLAYITGMVTAFLLYKRHVFEPGKHHTAKEAAHFCLVNLLAVAQTLIISILLADHALPALSIEAFRKEIAHAIGIGVPVFTSFLGHKYFTFRGQRIDSPS